jgi:hypothetical protein
MSKIRELIQARRAELLTELAECDEFLGEPALPPIPQARHADVVYGAGEMPPGVIEQAPGVTPEQLAAIIAMAHRQAGPPMARPRGASEATADAVLERALKQPARLGVDGLPVVNPSDRLVTDPKTGSVTRIPNGANQ